MRKFTKKMLLDELKSAEFKLSKNNTIYSESRLGQWPSVQIPLDHKDGFYKNLLKIEGAKIIRNSNETEANIHWASLLIISTEIDMKNDKITDEYFQNEYQCSKDEWYYNQYVTAAEL